jgi:superfamily II DNA or RNA helicase
MFGPAEENVVSDGMSLRDDLEFKGTPYEYQTNIINSFVNAGANGLICVPCGKGKTFMAVAIAAKLKKRFMVVVDKEFLMNQWRGELEALMPGIRVGIVQENKMQTGYVEEIVIQPTVPELKARLKALGLKTTGTKDVLRERLKAVEPEPAPQEPVLYDCCIAMIQTLCLRDFMPDEFKGFGLAIFDECHHLGAQHFSKTLQKVQLNYMLGLSATPTREDGLTKVFFWYLGEPVYWEKTREPDPTVEVKSIMISTDDITYNTVPTDWRGETVMARLLGNILGCEDRTAEIVRWIRKLCSEPDRKILVLSERIGHLEEIEKGLEGFVDPGELSGGNGHKWRVLGVGLKRVG